VEAASRRQKWIDQGQSLNLYMSEPSGQKMDNLYKLAWVRGLKTTYYLRSIGATHVEKSTMATRDGKLNAVMSMDGQYADAPGGSAAAMSMDGSYADAPGGSAAAVGAHAGNGKSNGHVENDLADINGDNAEAPKACSLLDPDCEACQ
jgi:ribonucleoside-diphosphate reductase alpha chain